MMSPTNIALQATMLNTNILVDKIVHRYYLYFVGVVDCPPLLLRDDTAMSPSCPDEELGIKTSRTGVACTPVLEVAAAPIMSAIAAATADSWSKSDK